MLEARDRIGGRVHTIWDRASPLPVELGAEFVHGDPGELWAALREARVPIVQAAEVHWWFDGKRVVTEELDDRTDPVFSAMARSRGDETFRQFLSGLPETAAVRKAVPSALSYIEGLDAADASRVGTAWLRQIGKLSDEIHGEEILHRPYGGYGRLLEHWGQGQEVHLNKKVTRVRWRKGHARVEVESGERFEASGVICTLPPNLLGKIVFEPGLPERQVAAGRLLPMGQIVRMVLVFDVPFWEEGYPTLKSGDPKDTCFLHGRGLPVPTWWTQVPTRAPLLTGWAGGPSALALTGKPRAEVARLALGSLSKLTGVSAASLRRRLQATHVADWPADPLARGAYVFGTVGARHAARDLARPVDNTLFFAGEASCFETLPGTVHAALVTGQRAAREVVRALS